MGLCKNIKTRLMEGSYVSAAEKRFGRYIESPKKKVKSATKPKPKSNKDFITDMLDGLL